MKEINVDQLKYYLARHIVTENFPFSYIVTQSFLELINVLNPKTRNLIIKADAIKDHILKKSIEAMEKLKNNLQAPEVVAANCRFIFFVFLFIFFVIVDSLC